MDGDAGAAFTKEGLFMNWLRHKAYFLGKSNFKAIDLGIPIAYWFGDTIDFDSMSIIVISVKSKTGDTDALRTKFLSKQDVEGIVGEGGGTIPANKNSNLRLTLNSLAFIKPDANTIADESLHGHWIQSTVNQPYIAFAMSLGDTHLTDGDKLFVPEKNVHPFLTPRNSLTRTTTIATG